MSHILADASLIPEKFAVSWFWLAVVVVLGILWGALHYSEGFVSEETIRGRQSNCENDLFFQGEQSIPAAQTRCSKKIADSIAFHRMMFVLVTPIYLIVFSTVHFSMARARKRHEDLRDAIQNRPPQEVVMGPKYGNITNSVVIHDSPLNNVEIKNEIRNPDLAKALQEIAAIVRNAQNPAASLELAKLSRELEKDKPDKSMLSATWASLKDILPVLKSGLEATVVFEKLIAS